MQNRSIGPFELQEQLGAGGMGVVYRAKYTKTGQVVALKVLSPGLQEDEKLIARFTRELEILKKLKHPNIVQCYGGGRLGAQRFYAMELVEGGSLSELLKKKGKFDWQQVIEYGLQICAALEHAHENGVVHRDLKPPNLMLDKSGNIKLADFGLARISDATALTAAGKTLGTFAYMAPEQISGSSPITPKTDLYAFGVVLYELVTGKTPFQSETTAELLMAHLTKKPPRVCTEVLDCPIWLEKVILNLMEKDPDKRPRDALAVEQALREVNEKVAHNVSVAEHNVTGQPTGIAVSTVGETDLAKLLKRKKKKKADGSPIYERTWFLASCLVAIVGLVTFLMWPKSEERLFALAQPLMKSEKVDDREKAETEYLNELIRRFPNGKHFAEAKQFVEDVELDRVEKLLMVKIEKGRELKEEVERHFKKAYDLEQFGDRETALEK
ncbi:MAG: Serine/threonine protein kinaserelated protein [Planctomycetaceae bacterium]|nr:Serine/threonine protein kinaserelated protein [Planctomycetaceae bacterium]